MKKMIAWFANEVSGQGMVEYSLILALIAIIVIGALRILGDSTYSLYNESVSKMP